MYDRSSSLWAIIEESTGEGLGGSTGVQILMKHDCTHTRAVTKCCQNVVVTVRTSTGIANLVLESVIYMYYEKCRINRG